MDSAQTATATSGIEERWRELSVRPPIRTNSISHFDPSAIAEHAQQTRIVIHPRFQRLVQDFLDHKRAHGSQYERQVYHDAFTWRDQISRLIDKRPYVFMTSRDSTVLRDGTAIRDGRAEWDRNGTEQQSLNTHLQLTSYLSYDEIMLSSLIGVSGPSFFINDGNRYNRGRPAPNGTFESSGIIVGLVGPRFERDDRMDSAHILPKLPSPRQSPLLSALFASFYGVRTSSDADFDTEMYKARIRITADILLLEANARAKEADKRAWTYVVGLGLGVWQYMNDQPGLYVDAFEQAISELELSHVGTVEFAWISVDDARRQRLTGVGKRRGIDIVFSDRNPAAKLQQGNVLLVLSYAWDGNALPGNEYWSGSLAGSGDPAAACMSTVGELHNPLINPFTSRIHVPGS